MKPTPAHIFIGFFVWISVTIVYLAVATNVFTQFHPSNFPYFTLLAESFIQRKYDLIHPPANPYDLSIYKGAVYLPWGPLPALLLMPVVYFWGIGISDIVYTAVFGGLNIVLVYVFLYIANKLLTKPSTIFSILLLTLFFAFGTVHFSMAIIGRVWFTSQIISLTIFLLSLISLVLFLRNQKSVWFIAAGGLLLLAFMGKVWYAALLPVYFGVFVTTALVPRNRVLVVCSIIFLVLLCARMYGLYNFRRFGSVFETGYTYQQESEHFLQLRAASGRFNPQYLPTNAWYTLLKPIQFINSYPYIKPDPIGNGLFMISPLFILLIYIGRIWQKEKKLILIAVGGVVLYSIQPLFFFGTGFFQFGHRYLLEIIPFLLLVLLPIVERVSRKITITLTITSVIVCSLGALWLQST